MFYCCYKCANIKNVTSKVSHHGTGSVLCEVCGGEMKPVPQEFLMNGGNFFKSQADRERLISTIKSLDTYDEEIASRTEELKQSVKEAQKVQVEEANERMAQAAFKVTCPSCGSNKTRKISTVGKYAKVGVLGILGADDLGKTWKCEVCGTKF